MTREEYIQNRNVNLDIDHLYEYYLNYPDERDKIDKDNFYSYFQHYLQTGGNVNQYYRYYDSLFELLFLNNKIVN